MNRCAIAMMFVRLSVYLGRACTVIIRCGCSLAWI